MHKILRKTHGILGLLFGTFLLIQGATAFLLAFEEPLENAIGKQNIKLIEKIHKGRIYGAFGNTYNALVGLSLVYLSFSGICMGIVILKAKNLKK